ncbi:hypothetical protein H1C71_021113 [Ictidomys tridecemlineatus]|nr:hypothetical protein H1C71_021113 [Ictidomys tridecemlineatus]
MPPRLQQKYLEVTTISLHFLASYPLLSPPQSSFSPSLIQKRLLLNSPGLPTWVKWNQPFWSSSYSHLSNVCLLASLSLWFVEFITLLFLFLFSGFSISVSFTGSSVLLLDEILLSPDLSPHSILCPLVISCSPG